MGCASLCAILGSRLFGPTPVGRQVAGWLAIGTGLWLPGAIADRDGSVVEMTRGGRRHSKRSAEGRLSFGFEPGAGLQRAGGFRSEAEGC
jgi:hypothetical protein